MKRASGTASASTSPGFSSRLYSSALRHFAAYLVADTVGRLPRGPSVHAEAENIKEQNLRGIQNVCEQIKRHALALPAHLPGTKSKHFSGLRDTDTPQNQGIVDLAGVYKEIRCSVGYDIFLYSILQDVQGRPLDVFRTHYEGMIAKQKIVSYLSQYARTRAFLRTARTAAFGILGAVSKAYNSEIAAEISQKLYCTGCKRVIARKMTGRHGRSKAHAKKNAVYVCLTPAACRSILQRYAAYTRMFQSEIRRAYNGARRTSTVVFSLVPRCRTGPESKTAKDASRKPGTGNAGKQTYVCGVCDTQMGEEKQFMRHFQKRKHRFELKKMGVADPDDFSGITTKKGVQARLHILSQ